MNLNAEECDILWEIFYRLCREEEKPEMKNFYKQHRVLASHMKFEALS